MNCVTLRLESQLLLNHSKLHLSPQYTYLKRNKFIEMEFGELVEPDTRAFWGDYDELEEE